MNDNKWQSAREPRRMMEALDSFSIESTDFPTMDNLLGQLPKRNPQTTFYQLVDAALRCLKLTDGLRTKPTK